MENPTHNNEIQQYKSGYVGTDSNDNLVLTEKSTDSNTFDSSRVNTSIYNGIKIGDGEKLSVEFEAQIPVARDINGNHVENVPLWPALWLMGNDQYNNEWLGWPFVLRLMLWNGRLLKDQLGLHLAMRHKPMSPTIGMERIKPVVTVIGQTLLITRIPIFILNFINGVLISIDTMMERLIR